MRFAIKDGVPYMVSEGIIYPLDIIGREIRLKDGIKSDLTGYLTMYELLAKYPEGYKDKKSDSVTDETSKPSAPRKRTKKNVD